MGRLILVDGQRLDEKGNTIPEGIPRLVLAQHLCQQATDKILLMGGKTNGIKRNCDAGEEFLLTRGVDKSTLLKEKDPYGSLDTVGELWFVTNEYSEELEKAQKIIVISSDYHERRMWKILIFFWRDPLMQKTEFIGVPRFEHGNYKRGNREERASFRAFQETFRWISRGDIPNIGNQMWLKHPLYKNHPSNPYKNLSPE